MIIGSDHIQVSVAVDIYTEKKPSGMFVSEAFGCFLCIICAVGIRDLHTFFYLKMLQFAILITMLIFSIFRDSDWISWN